LALWRSTDKLWQAGERQLAHLENTAERQLRAYIFVSDAKVLNVVEGNGPMEARVIIKNFGQTPAYKVATVNGFAFDKYPLPPTTNLIISHDAFFDVRTRSDFGPTQAEESIIAAAREPIRTEEREGLRNGNLAIFVYGEIRYLDAFGRNQRTAYRLMMGGPVGIRPGGQLIFCEEGNEAT
jgi:hypothetical protein